MEKDKTLDSSYDRPIRLVVLLQDLEFGGTQRYAIHLLKHLNRSLFDPELWVLKHGPDMVHMAEEAGINVVHVSRSSWVGPQGVGRLGWRLMKRPPELLYTLTVVPNIWGRILGSLARVPVIVSGYRSLLPAQLEGWLWPLANRIICNADALKEIMVSKFSVDPDRIAVVPNAVDADYFQSDPAAKAPEPTVLYVGRLVEEKDPLNALEGFCLAAERVPEARMEIVGNGPLKRELERRIRERGLESKVALLPAASDIRPHFNRAWVLTLVSAREASPNVIIEAMAMRLPVVATRVGGIPELVLHGRTGLLVEPHDPAGLADALVSVLDDEGTRASMGLAAREQALANHTLEQMVRRTEQILLEAVEESNVRAKG